MRFFEVLLFAVALSALITRLLPGLRQKAVGAYLPYAAGLLIPVQLLTEGYRWEMVPLYVFTLGLIIVSLFARKRADGQLIRNKVIRIVCIVLSFLLYVGSLVFPVLLPVVNLPEPEGPYAVGTVSYRLIDESREEVFTEDPGDVRNLLITAWYPADVEKGSPVERYWDREGVTGRAYSIDSGMGLFWYSHLNLVKTNSYPDAPVSASASSYPVLLYSPSFYGMNTENTVLCEDLASHGYIVFAINHSYETILSLYPDGEAVPGYLDHIRELYDAHADREDQLYEAYDTAETIDQKTNLVNQILSVDDQFTFLLKTRTEDAMFVMDEIERFNNGKGPFHGRIDTARAGILGWSFGGATAVEACMADGRFRAGVNIDGWPYGEQFSAREAIEQPFMMLRSDPEDEMETLVGNLVYEKMGAAGYSLIIEGAEHMNFWDFPLFFDVYKYIGYWGPIDAERLRRIHDTFTVGFFDKYLKGDTVDLRDALPDYPEVTMRSKGID